jgi:hypothetical protein
LILDQHPLLYMFYLDFMTQYVDRVVILMNFRVETMENRTVSRIPYS